MKRWMPVALSAICLVWGGNALSQSQSDYALLRRPVFKNPLIYKLTKSVTEYYWGTQLFINCYSAATSYVMTPSYQLLSAMSYHLDRDWNRLMYAESKNNWIRAFGSRGSGIGQFRWPRGVDAHGLCNADGYSVYYYAYVLDTQNERIAKLRYNWQLQQMEWLGTMGDENVESAASIDINNGGTFLSDADDYLWVVDRYYLKRFTADGVLRNTYGTSGHHGAIGTFCAPSAVTCGRSDDPEDPFEEFANNTYIYVADPGNRRIVWLEKSATGEEITWRGEVSTTADIFDLEADNSGQIWATDWRAGRIYKYTYDLFPLCTFGSFGTGVNQFRRPYAIYTHGGYLGCGNIAVNESWGDSSGLQYFCAGTDILDLAVDTAGSYRWHYIRYVLIDPSRVTVEIHGGPQKQFVKTIRQGVEWSGQCIHVWNGEKENGLPADSGWYYAVVFDTSFYKDIETGMPANTITATYPFYHAKNPYTNYTPGDVNNDGSANLADAVYLINYIFKTGPEPQPYICVGDVNADGITNIGDVVYMINYTFKSGPPPRDGCQSAP